MWPTIRCSGRTARPSTCQPRTMDSQACGSVKLAVRAQVLHRAGQLGRRRDVRDAARHRATSACAAASRHSQGASMSSTTRSTVAGSHVGRQRLGEVADARAARPGAGRRRTSRRCRARSRRSRRGARTSAAVPASPTARSSEQVSAPDPTPASTTRAPGNTSPMADDLAGVLGVDDGGAARHRQHEVGVAAAAAPGTRRRRCCVTTTPSGDPIRSSCASEPLWVWNSLPGSSVMVCIRPLGSVSWTRSPARNGPRGARPVGRRGQRLVTRCASDPLRRRRASTSATPA